jgi:hypothetical protein
VRGNQTGTYYNGFQTELRRRLSHGLQFNINYSYGQGNATTYLGFINGNVYRRPTGTEGDLTHQVKGLITYDLPFGQGRHYGGNASGTMERVIGGWQVDLSSVIHSGQLANFGNVNLVGMTKADMQKMIQLRLDPSRPDLVYMLPADVIQNDQRVQRERDVGFRLRRERSDEPATSRPPTVRAASRSGQPRASAARQPRRDGSAVPAARHRHREAPKVVGHTTSSSAPRC